MAILNNFGIPMGDATTAQTLMPKLQYRFRVVFTGLGAVGSKGTLVSQNIISATRPELTQEPIVIDTYNSKIHIAGKHTWSDITMTLRDDANNDVIRAIQAQMNKQVNHSDQTSAKAGENYKFTARIETLDGSHATDASSIIDQWFIEGCFITQATYGDLNYANSEVVQASITIRYDNATLFADRNVGEGAN